MIFYILKQRNQPGSIQIQNFWENSIAGEDFMNIICLESLKVYKSKWYESPEAKNLRLTLVVRVQDGHSKCIFLSSNLLINHV